MAIERLLTPSIHRGLILPVSDWSRFWVVTDGDKIIGCGRLHPWSQSEELQKLCVDPNYQHHGIASLLIHGLLEHRAKHVFALTVNPKVGNLFEKHGFSPIDKEKLPTDWKQQYPLNRHSMAYWYQ